jgi:hypothetical protein
MSQIISDFNSTLSDLFVNISKIVPDSIIANNINLIKSILLKNDEKSKKIIKVFIKEVYPYRSHIDNFDEKYFLDKNYDEEMKRIKSQKAELKGTQFQEMDLNSQIFKFKNIWGKFSKKNKKYVFQYLQVLCQLADGYIEELRKQQS